MLLLFLIWIVGGALLLPAQAPPPGQAAELTHLHFRQGMQFLKQRNWRAAADEFRKEIQINPLRAEAHDKLGFALARLGETQNAMAAALTAKPLPEPPANRVLA